MAQSCRPACWSIATLPHSRSDAPQVHNRKNSRVKNFVFVWRVVDQGTTGGDIWRNPVVQHAGGLPVLPRSRSDAPHSADMKFDSCITEFAALFRILARRTLEISFSFVHNACSYDGIVAEELECRIRC
jgi:hypothetical protein